MDSVAFQDGTAVPVVRSSASVSPPLTSTGPILPTVSPAKDDIATNRVYLAKAVVLPPASQTAVAAVSQHEGTFIIEPALELLESRGVTASNGVHQVRTHVPFPIMMTNFTNTTVTLPKGPVIGILLPEPATLFKSKVISTADVLGIELPEPDANIKEVPETARSTTEYPPEMQDLNLAHIAENQYSAVRDILIPGTRPSRTHPYRRGPPGREFEKKEVDRMIKEGVISPRKSEWASPVVLVPKPDGSLRFCVDYRKLNELSIRDPYPIPRMDECLDSLGRRSSLHHARREQRVLASAHGAGRQGEDSLHHSRGALRIQSDAFRPHKRSPHVPARARYCASAV